jgi:methylenetetrahydrofolate dehydrogenase (NADP+)/methenyltetrahydrofolate cyclohydrolase
LTLLDGKWASAQIKEEIKAEVDAFLAQGHRAPHLVCILVGNNGASETYVASKIRTCGLIGFKSTLIRYEDTVTEAELLDKIKEINTDDGVDGLLVQLPLPKHINEDKVIETINPAKDVDGFHPSSIGKMALNLPTFVPATPYGIVLLLEKYNINTSGMHCVVIGRSNIVGMPAALLMQRNAQPGNCTVTVCHSRTKNLPEITRQADLIIAALGKPEFLKADMIKEGAVIIDVGLTRIEDATVPKGYSLKGDVAFDEVAPKSSYITPVPGGVGLMTIAALMTNTLKAYKNSLNKQQ